MGKLITNTEVKAILQLSGSTYDTVIDVMIPIAEDYALNYCNISEYSGSVSPGIKLPLAQMINYQIHKPSNVTSETIGNYSVSYTNSYPKSILDGLRPYRRIKFIQDDSYDNWAEEIEDEVMDAGND